MIVTLLFLQNTLKCDHSVISSYESQCQQNGQCGSGGSFDTGAFNGTTGRYTNRQSCTNKVNGTSTRYVQSCGENSQVLLQRTLDCSCDVFDGSDLCTKPPEMEFCVVGGGPGAYGALLGLGSENLKKTLVLEKGVDAAHLQEQQSVLNTGPPFPSLGISSQTDQASMFGRANLMAAFKTFLPSNVPPKQTLTLWGDSNVIGGQFMFNGGLACDLDVKNTLNVNELDAVKEVMDDGRVAHHEEHIHFLETRRARGGHPVVVVLLG